MVEKENDSEEVKDYRQILHEILQRLDEAEEEDKNKEVNQEIIEKTKETKEANKSNQFDAVREDLQTEKVD